MFSALRLVLSFRLLRSKNRKSHGFILARAQQRRKDSRGRVSEQRGGNKRRKVALSEQDGRTDGRGYLVDTEAHRSVTSDRCGANVRDDWGREERGEERQAERRRGGGRGERENDSDPWKQHQHETILKFHFHDGAAEANTHTHSWLYFTETLTGNTFPLIFLLYGAKPNQLHSLLSNTFTR